MRMDIVVHGKRVDGAVLAPPSKSYTHRAMTLAMLAGGESVIERPLLGGDTLATLEAVRAFGRGAEMAGDCLHVQGGDLSCPEDVIDAANSGTTFRLMMGVASLLPCYTVITGDASIRRRPMAPLITALRQLGVECHSTRGNGLAPIIVRGPNTGAKASIRGDISSQFITSLLISSALKEVDTEIEIMGELHSRPYLDITLRMMREFGVRATAVESGFSVPGRQRYSPRRFRVPGDYSSAAFPLAAGALAGRCTVEGLLADDEQGDKAMVDILSRFGARVRRHGDSVTAERAELEGIKVDLGDAPDLFPILAVVATQARGRTVIRNAEHVRLKESDRIATTAAMLRSLGCEIEERRDGCAVDGPARLRGGTVDTHDDHRIMMAASVAALVASGPVRIRGAECHAISYPGFIDDLRGLGADVEVGG
jgi:3-phosphoshikimate 1-carboxyvinyltransferase